MNGWGDEEYARSMAGFFLVVALLWYVLILRG